MKGLRPPRHPWAAFSLAIVVAIGTGVPSPGAAGSSTPLPSVALPPAASTSPPTSERPVQAPRASEVASPEPEPTPTAEPEPTMEPGPTPYPTPTPDAGATPDPTPTPDAGPTPDPVPTPAVSEATPAEPAEPATATETHLAIAPQPSYAGQEILLRVTVVPDPGIGSVAWFRDGETITMTELAPGGTATLSVVETQAGARVFEAAFAGTGGFAPSASGPVAHTVLPTSSTTTTITASATRAIAGTLVTLVAAVLPVPPGGDVAWSANGRNLGTTAVDSAGRTEIGLELPLGRTTVTARFAGVPGAGASEGSIVVEGLAPLPVECTGTAAIATGLGLTADPVRNGTLTLYGSTIGIDPATIDYSRSPVNDAAWAMWFRSLVWLVPLATDAYVSGSSTDRDLITSYVDAWRWNPDPGSSTSSLLAATFARGWDEGTNLRRQQVLNCLVQLHPSTAVSQLLEATIRANLDPVRYYGPPRRLPHNHGLMANLTLIDTGVLLGRQELIDTAAARLMRDVATVADACGMTYEQSAGYQGLNARLWEQAAVALERIGRPADAAIVRGPARRMALAYGHLIAPDGRLAAIGDGNVGQASPMVAPTSTRMLCSSSGWAVARLAWVATTTWYALRFGPARSMHGHADHGAISWHPGRSVLVDGGTYAGANATYRAWYPTNAAHNVLQVSGLNLTGRTSLVRARMTTTVDTYTVRDSVSAVTRTRSVRVDRGLPLLVVLDRARSSSSRTFSQRWQFDVGWRWNASRGRLVSGAATAGVVAMDLRTGRMIAPTVGSGWILRPDGSVTSARRLSVARSGSSASILTVVYVSTTGARPVIRWYPGRTAGTGIARIWWGRIYRDVAIDATGMK